MRAASRDGAASVGLCCRRKPPLPPSPPRMRAERTRKSRVAGIWESGQEAALSSPARYRRPRADVVRLVLGDISIGGSTMPVAGQKGLGGGQTTATLQGVGRLKTMKALEAASYASSSRLGSPGAREVHVSSRSPAGGEKVEY